MATEPRTSRRHNSGPRRSDTPVAPTVNPHVGAPSAEDVALAAIVRSAEDAVISKTVAGVVTSWNAAATAIYGYLPGQMIGQSIERMWPAEALSGERARHQQVAAGYSQTGYRCRRVCGDGRVIEVVMSLSPVREPAGNVTGVASISRPVTEGEESDAMFASLLEAAPDGMLCVDVNGTIGMANAQAGVLFGYEPGELLGLQLDALLPDGLLQEPPEPEAGFVSYPRVRQMGAGQPLTAERRDGSTFPVEVSLASQGADDKMIVIAAVRDITRQRELHAALRVTESHLRQLAEHVDTVFILRQLNPRAYLYVNAAYRRVTGREVTTLLDTAAMPPSGLVYPHDLALARAFSDACWAGEAADSEFRIVRLDGEVRWVRTHAVPVPRADGPVERVVSSMEDITERVQANLDIRAAEAAARAANEAKNLFLSRMSHELRTPLNTVLGFGQLLERRLASTDHALAIDHILKGGRQLLDLINEVLDIARIESGDVSVDLEPIHAGGLIEETCTLIRPLADAADVSVHLAPCNRDVFVHADRQRLRQVLLNLLSNAIKYNHPGGDVWISAADSDEGVLLTVRDDGRGIAPELHSRLFTPFDRLGAEFTGIEGTGVGLAVSRALVGVMNGTIGFTSDAGDGTTFTITLPKANRPEGYGGAVATSRPQWPTAAPADHTSATLLYIEDNDDNVTVLRSVLGLRPGWRMEHTATGGEGLRRARAEVPDLIVLDLHLRGLRGFDVVAELKSDPRTALIPVVVLTADANAGHEERLLAAGAHRYFTKPMDVNAILGLLDELMSKLPQPSSRGGAELGGSAIARKATADA